MCILSATAAVPNLFGTKDWLGCVGSMRGGQGHTCACGWACYAHGRCVAFMEGRVMLMKGCVHVSVTRRLCVHAGVEDPYPWPSSRKPTDRYRAADLGLGSPVLENICNSDSFVFVHCL